MESNKLIAEFMGQPLNGDMAVVISGLFGNGTKTLVPLQYHTSWDWLIPVVEKIEGLGYSVWFQSVIEGTQVSIWKGMNVLFRPVNKNKIDAVYSAIIDFIKYYNQHPTN